MKTLILSAATAAVLGLGFAAPASADCRTVEKTTYRDGVKRTVTSRECSDDRVERRVYRDDDRRYVDRRDYRDDRPGITLRLPN